jgi:hypothetical protein
VPVTDAMLCNRGVGKDEVLPMLAALSTPEDQHNGGKYELLRRLDLLINLFSDSL